MEPRLFIVLILLALSCAEEVAGPEDNALDCSRLLVKEDDQPTQTGATQHVHDPAIIEQDGVYYVFSTGRGIPIRRSEDLVNWSPAGRVFSRDVPAWATSRVPGVEFPWAPDISFFGGLYHLYYSISTFGHNRSAIGLATNLTLDSDDPDYGWIDQGPIVESWPERDDYNAIDPNVAFDAEGRPWLSWGSYWGGIKMRMIDATSGRLSSDEERLHALVRRPAEHAVEAPFIIRRGDFYYLFVSFDACCRGAESTYKVMAGRSRAITGPYADRSGRSMMQGGGTLVLEGYGRIRGPGHNAVLAEGDHHFLVHHFYDAEEEGVPTLQIRHLLWDEEGWPAAGAPYDGGCELP